MAAEAVRELHRDLARKFEMYGPEIERIWLSLSQSQRIKVMKAGAADGVVPKHRFDQRLRVWFFMPEWNLRDITSTSSKLLIEILKYRAKTRLLDQYVNGFNEGPGDHAHILEMMERYDLQLENASEYEGRWSRFTNEEQYGNTYNFLGDDMTPFLPLIRSMFVVPETIGGLIVHRQTMILQALNIVIEDILDAGSPRCIQEQRPKPAANAATEALANFSVLKPKNKVEFTDLLDASYDRKSALEDSIKLISTEPMVLAHKTNFWFFSRPELLPDEKGRTLLAHTDRYITGAIYDAVQDAVNTAAVWSYVAGLMNLLDSSRDKRFRAIVLQELSNTCNLEFMRAKDMFKRSVSAFSGGRKWFKRVSTPNRNGVVRILMKNNPESLTIVDPQLHYILRLCLDDTDWKRSADWLRKLEDLHQAHPSEKEKMAETEYESLGDLAIFVTFMDSLSSIVQLPAPSREKGQLFVSEYSALETELRELKAGLDLSKFSIPIDNLLEPGMAENALKALNEYYVEHTGTKLGFLYQDLVDNCITDIHKQHELQKANTSKANAAAEYITPSAPEAQVARVQRRKQKEKTRPAQSTTYEISPGSAYNAETALEKASIRDPVKVKASTVNVLSQFLSISSGARGSVSWNDFLAAMSDVGFSITPSWGSIYTFYPPLEMGVKKSLILHRLHQSSIEGHCLLFYSRRLKRVYGWNESTFIAQ